MAKHFYGIEIASHGNAEVGDARLLLEALDILRPRHAPGPLIRLGGESDGAYLVPLDLEASRRVSRRVSAISNGLKMN